MAIEALEGVTDQELFDEANADEVATDEVVAEAPEPEAEQPEQARDDQGRFAAQAVEEPVTNAAVEQPARQPVDDNAAMVPSWRVREINDEKRTMADRLAALEAERVQWQQRQQQPAPQPQPAPAPQVEEPDPLLDPKGYREFIREETRKEILNDRRESSLAQAHRTYKTEFDEAYSAAEKAMAGGDRVLAMKMNAARDPGETLIEWHREQKVRAEVGNDPNAFFQKRLDAWLADPANQAKVIEKARSAAQPQQQPGTTRQASPVNLPPSLTRATNASADISADDDDVSNDALWRHANG
jgi:hypothetical protein